MLIGKNWKIESDSMNITLFSRHTVRAKPSKPAHDTWRTEGFYSTIEQALIGLVNQGVRDTELADLKTITLKQNELYQLIGNL